MAASESISNVPMIKSCVACLEGDAKQTSVVAWCCKHVALQHHDASSLQDYVWQPVLPSSQQIHNRLLMFAFDMLSVTSVSSGRSSRPRLADSLKQASKHEVLGSRPQRS